MKKLLSFVLIFIMIFTVSACSSKDNSSSQTDEVSTLETQNEVISSSSQAETPTASSSSTESIASDTDGTVEENSEPENTLSPEPETSSETVSPESGASSNTSSISSSLDYLPYWKDQYKLENLPGKNFSNAQKWIPYVEYECYYIYDNSQPKGNIVYTVPESDAARQPGQTIQIYVSAGPAFATATNVSVTDETFFTITGWNEVPFVYNGVLYLDFQCKMQDSVLEYLTTSEQFTGDISNLYFFDNKSNFSPCSALCNVWFSESTYDATQEQQVRIELRVDSLSNQERFLIPISQYGYPDAFNFKLNFEW